MAEEFDIIIVGSGAGGGTLAHTLALTGKRIGSVASQTALRGTRPTAASGVG